MGSNALALACLLCAIDKLVDAKQGQGRHILGNGGHERFANRWEESAPLLPGMPATLLLLLQLPMRSPTPPNLWANHLLGWLQHTAASTDSRLIQSLNAA